MNNILTIAQRDLLSLLRSPIAFLTATLYLFLMGFFFYTNVQYYAQISFQVLQTDPTANVVNVRQGIWVPMLANFSVLMLFMVPALTMRLFAEEKRSGTLELLLTSPLRMRDIVLGKFLSAYAFYLAMAAVLPLYALILAMLGHISLGIVLATCLGLLLFGAALIAIGSLVSAAVENQILAAVITVAIFLFLWVVDWLKEISDSVLTRFLHHLTLVRPFDDFAGGVVSCGAIAFYLAVTVISLLLAAEALQAWRWRR